MPHRIEFKLTLLALRCLHDYMAPSLPYTCGKHRLRSGRQCSNYEGRVDIFSLMFSISPYILYNGLPFGAPVSSAQYLFLNSPTAGRRLCSVSTLELNVPPTRRVTVGDRAIGDAAARVWNGL